MSKISVNKTNINKIKRLLLMLLVCTVIGGLFLGCGSKNNTESKDDYDFILIKKDIEIENVDTLCKSALYYDKKLKLFIFGFTIQMVLVVIVYYTTQVVLL